MTKRVEIFTDGACSGNPGPGGWGAILRLRSGGVNDGFTRELKGGEPQTTNNRMELLAAINGLNAVTQPYPIDLYTDSEYVRNGIEKWLAGWRSRGWRTKDGKPVKNQELWQALDEARKRHNVTWHWVRGHSGHPENERADQLARLGMAPFKLMKGSNDGKVSRGHR
jgi:ribonuclease HI